MPSVLVSPVDFSVSDAEYGKSYNILNNLAAQDFTIDAYAGNVESPLGCESVTLHSLDSETTLEYLFDAYQVAYEHLRDGDIDLYHHMNLGYRWFNPLLIANLADSVPTVIGPAQGGHDILRQEFHYLIDHAVGFNVPQTVTDPLYSVFDRTRSMLIDPPRIRLYCRTLQKADTVVAVHQDAKDLLANFVDESKIEVVPLGVDPTEFTFSERSNTSSLVAIGMLKERKGYDILLDALASVSAEFPEVQLHIFGEGPLRGKLESQAERNGLADHVTFHGYVDQSVLQKYLADARAFVHPSRSESFSLVRLEAMATGTPMVVSNTAGATEMVRDGTEGYVVPIEDSDALADAISRVLGDFELARQMGRNARAHVEETYDWSTIGQQYIDIYRSLL